MLVEQAAELWLPTVEQVMELERKRLEAAADRARPRLGVYVGS